jgi:hypothetical protein
LRRIDENRLVMGVSEADQCHGSILLLRGGHGLPRIYCRRLNRWVEMFVSG